MQKKAAFDHMSTEELEQLLRAHSQSSANTGIDEVFSILEVIEKREKMNPSGKYTDVDTAWDSFNKNYRPASNETESLYDFAVDIKDNAISHSDSNESKTIGTRRLIKHKVLIRLAAVLSSLLIVLFSGAIVARALGFNLWNVVAHWTMETFGFSSTLSDDQASPGIQNGQNKFKSLQDALDTYKITAKLVPSWLPNGYSLQNIDLNETPKQTTIHANYRSSDNEIIIMITSYTKPVERTYEKDGGNVIEYEMDETKYYIMSNLDQTNIIWQIENYECSISGAFSIDEAKEIINSIY